MKNALHRAMSLAAARFAGFFAVIFYVWYYFSSKKLPGTACS